MRRIILALSALLALALQAPLSTMAQGPQSQIRVMHDSPDAPAVDVYVDGKLAFENVAFSTTTDYQSLAPGQHHVQVTPTGKSADDSAVDTTVDLTSGKPYTVLALGKLADIKAELLADTSKQPPAGQTRVRIIHAAADRGPLDIYPTGSSTPLLTDQYFGSADYVNIPAGTYTFDIAPAGSTQVALTSQQLKLEPGWVYSLTINQPDGAAAPLIRASVDRLSNGAAAPGQSSAQRVISASSLLASHSRRYRPPALLAWERGGR
jgi:hypothetical protein